MLSAIIPQNWYDLFDDFEPAWVWNIYIGHIQNQILDSYPIPVPYLTDARLYNLGSLVVKLKHLTKATKRSLLGPLGPAEQFCSGSDQVFNARKNKVWEVPAEGSGGVKAEKEKPFEYVLQESRNKVKKEIVFTVEAPRKWVWGPLAANEVTFDLDTLPKTSKPLHNVYIIDEVFYTPQLSMRLQIGKEQRWYQWRWLPIGFTLTQYRVNREASIGRPVRILNGLNFSGKWMLYSEYGEREKTEYGITDTSMDALMTAAVSSRAYGADVLSASKLSTEPGTSGILGEAKDTTDVPATTPSLAAFDKRSPAHWQRYASYMQPAEEKGAHGPTLTVDQIPMLLGESGRKTTQQRVPSTPHGGPLAPPQLPTFSMTFATPDQSPPETPDSVSYSEEEQPIYISIVDRDNPERTE